MFVVLLAMILDTTIDRLVVKVRFAAVGKHCKGTTTVWKIKRSPEFFHI